MVRKTNFSGALILLIV